MLLWPFLENRIYHIRQRAGTRMGRRRLWTFGAFYRGTGTCGLEEVRAQTYSYSRVFQAEGGAESKAGRQGVPKSRGVRRDGCI